MTRRSTLEVSGCRVGCIFRASFIFLYLPLILDFGNQMLVCRIHVIVYISCPAFLLGLQSVGVKSIISRPFPSTLQLLPRAADEDAPVAQGAEGASGDDAEDSNDDEGASI
jgi:hypothetical protein